MTTETTPHSRHCTRKVAQRVEMPDGSIKEITVTERRLKKQHDKQLANERRRTRRPAADAPDGVPPSDSKTVPSPVAHESGDHRLAHDNAAPDAAETEF